VELWITIPAHKDNWIVGIGDDVAISSTWTASMLEKLEESCESEKSALRLAHTFIWVYVSVLVISSGPGAHDLPSGGLNGHFSVNHVKTIIFPTH
jgi:hypothetical protein